MRISDWSSDVCSSDLVDRIGQHLQPRGAKAGHRPRHVPGRGHQQPGPPVALPDQRRRQAGVLRRVARLGLEAHPRRIDALLREEARGDLGFVPAARIEPAREAGHDERSEEHTSELQSLMRISYAVFSLKTKKTSTYL